MLFRSVDWEHTEERSSDLFFERMNKQCVVEVASSPRYQISSHHRLAGGRSHSNGNLRVSQRGSPACRSMVRVDVTARGRLISGAPGGNTDLWSLLPVARILAGMDGRTLRGGTNDASGVGAAAEAESTSTRTTDRDGTIPLAAPVANGLERRLREIEEAALVKRQRGARAEVVSQSPDRRDRAHCRPLTLFGGSAKQRRQPTQRANVGPEPETRAANDNVDRET